MVKLIHFSHIGDWHLGKRDHNLNVRYNDNFNAVAKLAKSILDKNLEEPFDFVIHCGDLFAKPKPSPMTLCYTIELLAQFKDEGIPFYVIRGNHDASPGLLSNNSLHLLDKVELIKLIDDEVVSLTIKNQIVKIYGLGHRYNDYFDHLIDLVTQNPLNPDNVNILVLHTSIIEMEESDGRKYPGIISIKDLEIFGFDYIALGHHHKMMLNDMKNGKICYCGASEHWNKSNWEVNGVWSLEKKWIEGCVEGTKKGKSIIIEPHAFTVRPKLKQVYDFSEITPEKAISKIKEILGKVNNKFKEKRAIIDYSFILDFNPEERDNPFLYWRKDIPNLLEPACNIHFYNKKSTFQTRELKKDGDVIDEIVSQHYPETKEKWKKLIYSSLDIISLVGSEEGEEQIKNMLLNEKMRENVRAS